MTSIQSFSETLAADDPISLADQRRFVSIIHDESRRLTRLLDELLDISRFESGTVKLQIGHIEVKAAISAALDAISGVTRKASVLVDIEYEQDALCVKANEDRLHQVLLNILMNAVKYNDSDQPEVRINAYKKGEHVLIDIMDNGGGVSQEDAATIFEKFSRGSKSARGKGAGLGLPISRAIMRAMGGDLTAEFSDGGTSYFRLRLLNSAVPS